MAFTSDVALFDTNRPKTDSMQSVKQYAANSAYKSAASAAALTETFTFDMTADTFSMNAYHDGNQFGNQFDELPKDEATRALNTEAMLIAANSMSRSDFSEMLKEGFSPHELNVKDTVTVMDKIKASLAQAGVVIDGLTDHLSAKDLDGIIDDPALAARIARQLKAHDLPATPDNIKEVDAALTQAKDLKRPDENTLKYMVLRKLTPTLSNIYLAQHATANKKDIRQIKGMVAENGYYTKKAENFDWENLKPQMEKIISQAGLSLTDANIEDAKWFIEKSVPLTPFAFSLFKDIVSFQMPESQEAFMEKIIQTMADGKRAKNTSLSDSAKPLMQIAQSAFSTIQEARDIHLHAVNASGKILNILNLRSEMKITTASLSQNQPSYSDGDGNFSLITARRKLEEARLMMTVSANIRLLRSGVALETVPLEDLVSELKALEAKDNKILFQTNDSKKAADFSAQYKDVINKCNELREMPSTLVGKLIAYRDENGLLIPAAHGFTIRSAYGVGAVTMSNLKLAGMRYETLMTQVRPDLGDSQKKIANIVSLLENIGLEPTDENRRAVKILGANTMPVTAENIHFVQEADTLLQHTIEALTPMAVLKLIRGGFDPLNMNMAKLHDYLMMMDNTSKEKMEDYAKFIYKLEKSGEISKEEKKSFIGIYKMVRIIEHSEGAVIGGLLTRNEMTFSNLVGAARTLQRKSAFQASVDKNNVSSVSSDRFKRLDLDVTRAINGDWDRMQYLKDKLDLMRSDPQLEEEYITEQYKDFLRVAHTEEEVLALLERYGENPSAENLIAAQILMMNRGATFGKIFEKCMEYDEMSLRDEYSDDEESENSISNEMTEKVFRLQEAFGNPQQIKKEYASFSHSLQDMIDRFATREDHYSEIKQLQALSLQLSLANSLAQKENYELPVIINDTLTSINLRIISPQNAEDGGSVSITMQTKEWGKIAASFVCRDRTVMGYMAAASESGYRKSRSMTESLQLTLEGMEFSSARISAIKGTSLDLATFAKNIKESMSDSGDAATSAELYKVAKAFISVLQN